MRVLATALLLLSVLQAFPALAQEGFPLDGTWRGQWGSEGEKTLVVIVMAWDGEHITGRINPGRNAVNISAAELDASNWQVRIEATARSGEPIVIAGVLENIGSYQRTITGTWTIGGVESPLILTRE
ncbi:MAG: hypothetical protein RQ899_04745 [Pseudomonadales bacterium]|nr:hypothetical protein [Pseudomonadales bacterium]